MHKEWHSLIICGYHLLINQKSDEVVFEIIYIGIYKCLVITRKNGISTNEIVTCNEQL